MKIHIPTLLIYISLTACRARFAIEITTPEKGGDTKIRYSGVEERIVEDEDLKKFGISESDLADAVHKYYGTYPTDVYVKSPTPWGDLYKRYKWKEVRTHLHIVNATVVEIKRVPLKRTSTSFTNKMVHTDALFKASGSEKSVNTLSTSWSEGMAVKSWGSVEVKVNVVFAKASASAGIECATSWGNSTKATQTVELISSSGVEISLNPGIVARATLHMQRVLLRVEVEYSTFLKGDVAVNFEVPVWGHHFYAEPISLYLFLLNKQNSVRSNQIIEVDYLYESTVEITELTDQQSV